MPCRLLRMDDGTVMFACARGRQPQPKCIVCGAPAPWLCDAIVAREPGGPDQLCSAPICTEHRQRLNGADYCPKHRVEETA
jgi:hypothetical protein